jgi:hypothetical protein
VYRSALVLGCAVAAVAAVGGIAVQPGQRDASASSVYCNPSLVGHTYNLSRFTVLSPACRKVTGTVKSVLMEVDGDAHVKIKPDDGQSGLSPLENGLMVLEVICKKTPDTAAAKKACGSYRSPLKLPAVGAHIAAVGRFVKDNPPDHVELHPLTSITVLSGKTLTRLPPLDKHAEADE